VALRWEALFILRLGFQAAARRTSHHARIHQASHVPEPLAGLLLAVPSPAEDEGKAVGHERVDSQEMLGVALSTPIEWHGGEGEDIRQHPGMDVDSLREMLGIEETADVDESDVLHAVTLAAIQGLYEQIQERDKLLLQLDEQNQQLRRKLTELESDRREDRARINRLDTRLNSAVNRIERRADASTPGRSPVTQSQRIVSPPASPSEPVRPLASTVKMDQIAEDARRVRVETQVDRSLMNLQRNARMNESRLRSLETHVQTQQRGIR